MMVAAELPNMRPELSPGLAEVGPLSAAGEAAVAGAQSAAEAVAALVDKGLNQDAVAALANGMQDESAVRFGVEAAKMVSDKLPDADLGALAAAEGWLAGAPAAEAELDAVLEAGPMDAPGAWAAKAASWAGETDPLALEAQGGTTLAGKAVDAAVKLAAALTKQDYPLAPQQAAALADMADGMSVATDAPAAELSAAEMPGMPQVPEFDPAALEARSGMADGLPLSSADVPSVDMPAAPEAPEIDPAALAELNDLLKPFVDLGMKIAAGELG